MGEEAYADYHAAVHDPATVHAMLEDYRAGLGIDRAHDKADQTAGHTVQCPVLVLWALKDYPEPLCSDMLAIWVRWASNLYGHGIDCGHHMAEEAPEALAALLPFLAGS